MPHGFPSIWSPFVGRRSQTASRSKFQHNSKPPKISIHNLDDDSLLNIFHLCRPNPVRKDEYGNTTWDNWDEERWWYELVKVCRRWRCLILASASHLRLCLVCTFGTPIAEMLAHSPPLPLIIKHNNKNHDLTAEDEQGIMFALNHRDRVRRIYLAMPVPCLQKLIKAMDGQFPILEYLRIVPPTKHDAPLIFPSTFEAPQLHTLRLDRFASPIGSPLLTTAVGLVMLSLRRMRPSTYLHPNHLFQALSLLPQLQGLEIMFSSTVPNREIEQQLLGLPIITHTALPNLRSFHFGGVIAYLEAILPYMKTPLLDTLSVWLSNQPSFSVPHLRQFVTTTVNLGSSHVELIFYHKGVAVLIFLSVATPLLTLYVYIGCNRLDWQVSSMAQIFNVLGPLFSNIVDLTLNYRSHALSSEWHNQGVPTQWRELLGSFRNVETVRVHDDLVGELSRCLALDKEPRSEFLPKLKSLVCPIGSRDAKTFATFLYDREVAGLPVDLIEEIYPAKRKTCNLQTASGVDRIR